MTRRGFVPYGPSGAAVEAMARVMGPQIVWLSSPEAAGVHDEPIVAREIDAWLAARGSRGL